MKWSNASMRRDRWQKRSLKKKKKRISELCKLKSANDLLRFWDGGGWFEFCDTHRWYVGRVASVIAQRKRENISSNRCSRVRGGEMKSRVAPIALNENIDEVISQIRAEFRFIYWLVKRFKVPFRGRFSRWILISRKQNLRNISSSFPKTKNLQSLKTTRENSEPSLNLQNSRKMCLIPEKNF